MRAYSGSQFNEIQEPHPQPPPRKQGGGYDIPHVIGKCYRQAHKPLAYD